MRRLACLGAAFALSACGQEPRMGVGDYRIDGATITCGDGGQLVVYEQQGAATCQWFCVGPGGEPGLVDVEFMVTGSTWSVRSTTVVGPNCHP